MLLLDAAELGEGVGLTIFFLVYIGSVSIQDGQSGRSHLVSFQIDLEKVKSQYHAGWKFYAFILLLLVTISPYIHSKGDLSVASLELQTSL